MDAYLGLGPWKVDVDAYLGLGAGLCGCGYLLGAGGLECGCGCLSGAGAGLCMWMWGLGPWIVGVDAGLCMWMLFGGWGPGVWMEMLTWGWAWTVGVDTYWGLGPLSVDVLKPKTGLHSPGSSSNVVLAIWANNTL